MNVNASAAVAAAIANATKASGVIVHVAPETFQTIVARSEDALVIHAEGGIMKKKHKYLTSYKGLAFYTKAGERLFFRTKPEIVESKKIWVPDM